MSAERPEVTSLSDAEFHQYFAAPMKDVTPTATQHVDIWPYVERVFDAEFSDSPTDGCNVKWVYETSDQNYQHVLIPMSDDDTPLVIVIDTRSKKIMGHHLLNLKQKYGIAH